MVADRCLEQINGWRCQIDGWRWLIDGWQIDGWRWLIDGSVNIHSVIKIRV